MDGFHSSSTVHSSYPSTSVKKQADHMIMEDMIFPHQSGQAQASGSAFSIHSSHHHYQQHHQQQVQQRPTTTEIEENDPLLHIHEDFEFPEGGLRANLVVFGSFMGILPAFGMVNSAGAIESYVSSHQLANVPTSAVSWVFSINTFIAFSCGIFSGAYFDKNGARFLMILGTLFFCSGLFATGNCETVYQFVLAFGVMNGLGLGILMSPLIGVVSHYFKKKRATACSIATVGASAGGVVFPLLLRKLYPTVGFTWAMRILAFVCFGCLCFSIVFARERISNKIHDQEAENEEPQISNKTLFKTYILDTFDFSSLKQLDFLFCSLAIMFSESSLIVTSIYFPSYAIERGFGENTAYLLITVVNSTGVLGRYLPGYIADKYFGRFNVCILTLLGCVLVSFILWLPFGHSLKVLYTFAGFYGFCSGSILSLAPVCCGQISRTDQFGKRYSTTYMIAALGMLGFIPLGGAVISKGDIHNYNNFIIYSSMLSFTAMICYGISRHVNVGFKLCKF